MKSAPPSGHNSCSAIQLLALVAQFSQKRVDCQSDSVPKDTVRKDEHWPCGQKKGTNIQHMTKYIYIQYAETPWGAKLAA